MSDQRRFKWKSGRLTSSPLTDFFALGRAPVLTLPLEGGETPYVDSRPVVITPSVNIPAGGEATTSYGFTAPPGKTLGDFFTGRRWDDENGVDSLTLTADDWTNVGWSIKLNATLADGVQYEFRVVADGVPLDTYTVTPRVTIGTPVAPAPPLRRRDVMRAPDPLLFGTEAPRKGIRIPLPPSTGVQADSSDTVTFSDVATSVVTIVAAASDTLTVSDSSVAALTAVAAGADSLSLNDSAAASTTFAAAATDSVTFSDVGEGAIVLVATSADAVTFSDSSSAILTAVATASDSISTSDAATAISTLVAAAADTVTLSDSSVATRGGVAAGANDTVAFSDIASATLSAAAVASDAVAFSDEANALLSAIAAATDSVTFSDSAIGGQPQAAAAADSITFGDTAQAIRVPAGTGGGRAWLRAYLQEIYEREFAEREARKREAEQEAPSVAARQPVAERRRKALRQLVQQTTKSVSPPTRFEIPLRPLSSAAKSAKPAATIALPDPTDLSPVREVLKKYEITPEDEEAILAAAAALNL